MNQEQSGVQFLFIDFATFTGVTIIECLGDHRLKEFTSRQEIATLLLLGGGGGGWVFFFCIFCIC
jgi:hypothetical protein